MRKSNLGYLFVLAFWVLSIILTFSARNQTAMTRYKISQSALRTIQATLSLPNLFIWLSMFFAAQCFYRYARQIIGSKDSQGFRCVSYGLMALLLSAISVNLLNALRVLLSESSDNPLAMQRTLVVVSNYTSVIAALAIYGYFYKGSRSLLRSINKQLNVKKDYIRTLLPVAILSAVYLYLIFANPQRRYTSDPLISPTFALPDFLILSTVAIPYIFSWFLGVMALVGIHKYRAAAKGIVYKLLLKRLVWGMTLVIALTIVLQLIGQFSGFWSQTGLSIILSVIMVIYLVLIAAYLLVAKGARQLNSIETYIFKQEA